MPSRLVTLLQQLGEPRRRRENVVEVARPLDQALDVSDLCDLPLQVQRNSKLTPKPSKKLELNTNSQDLAYLGLRLDQSEKPCNWGPSSVGFGLQGPSARSGAGGRCFSRSPSRRSRCWPLTQGPGAPRRCRRPGARQGGRARATRRQRRPRRARPLVRRARARAQRRRSARPPGPREAGPARGPAARRPAVRALARPSSARRRP